MRRNQMWKLYMYVFIKTPIAALLFISALVLGIGYLTNTISVRVYASLQGSFVTADGGTMLEAALITASSELKEKDNVTWYVKSSGERYASEVARIDDTDSLSIKVQIQVDAQQWEKAKAEAETDQPSVTIELPIGRQSLKHKLFSGKGGETP